MKDTILICAVAVVFIFGYFLMDKVDKFIENNQRAVSEFSDDPALNTAFKAPTQMESEANMPEEFAKEKPNCEFHLFPGSVDGSNCPERKRLLS